MGYPNSNWVKPFVHGKVVDTIEQDGVYIWIRFMDGTSLRMYVVVKPPEIPKSEVITTPIGSDGQVVQSINIIKRKRK